MGIAITFVAGPIASHASVSILLPLLVVLAVIQRTHYGALQDPIAGFIQAVLTTEPSAVIQRGLVEAAASPSLLGRRFSHRTRRPAHRERRPA